jgi:three-Cys-motif partner protein
LKELQDEFPNFNIQIKQGDCNTIIVSEIATEIRFENFNRGIIFLDPFGMDIEWETIEHIADTRALEIFLNFPVMAINRSVLIRQAYKLKPEQIERMNLFWGSPDWRADLYEEAPTLFEPEVKKIPQTGQSLGKLFTSRLNEVFPEVSEPLVMTNSKNAPLYCLIFAGHKESGKKIAQNIFARYEKLGE